MEDNKLDNAELNTHNLLIENCKLTLEVINYKKRIDQLEKSLLYRKTLFIIFQIFTIFDFIDLILRAIFGINICKMIVSYIRILITSFNC